MEGGWQPKVLVLLALVAGAFASSGDCPANSHYEECGTACPTTCDNYENPPKVCVLMCVSGCFCDEGYVQTEEGKCVKPERCAAEKKNCVDEPETGMCRGYFPMFYYDEDAKDCKQFIYGGCQGNGNRYATKEQCLKKCAPIFKTDFERCSLPAEAGLCKGYFPRFYFDKAAGQCKKFIYGGCGGNANNFETEEDCHNGCVKGPNCGENRRYNECGTACPLTCENYDNPPKVCNLMCKIGCECEDGFVLQADGKCVRPEQCPNRQTSILLPGQVCGENERYNACGTDCPLTCENYDQRPLACNFMCKIGCECENGFVRGADGKCIKPEQCPNRQAALDRPDCDKPAESGLCRAYIPRYYYDQEAGQCLKFIYGGCGGNRNNFKTEEECYNKCGALQSFSRELCNLEREVGPCRAAFRRFHFNRKTGQCEQFIYGGCAGNENNFNTQQECERRCLV